MVKKLELVLLDMITGMAADIDLVDAKDGHKLDMTNDMDMARIYEFTKLVKALGLTGIGAGDIH